MRILSLQLAVSNVNKLYIWGASPQVLRLQAQAQKKTRILEQQDANEKKSKTLRESEKIPSTTNLNEKIKEDDAQINFAQTKTITSEIETQKTSETENADLKDLSFDLIEESQAHLKPCVVDTSLIKGQINQVCNSVSRSLKFICFAFNPVNIILKLNSRRILVRDVSGKESCIL